MRRHILTGAPGSGKTAIARVLENLGHVVVEEAATDVIALDCARGVAEPHLDSRFIDRILALQIHRREAARGPLQFHDRSPVCCLALANFLGRTVSPALAAELERIRAARTYETVVFFVRNLGFCTQTQARRISFADCLEFEKIHEDAYASLGFQLEMIEVATPDVRAQRILDTVNRIRAPERRLD